MSLNLVNNESGGSGPSYGAMEPPPDVTFSNFSPTEFYNLCENITSNIYSLSSGCKNLDKAFKSLGSGKDNASFRDNIHTMQLNTNQIIAVTTKDITRLKIIVRKGDKQQKLQVDKLTSDFKEAFETFVSLQKRIVVKMKANMLVPSDTFEGETAKDDDRLLREQQQQQQVKELAFEHGMLVDQEERINRIESDILDINQIMRDLNTIVHEQGETIDSIENNVENARGNVEEAVSQLQKAETYQNKARRKLIVLIVLALIVASALIAVLVSYLR